MVDRLLMGTRNDGSVGLDLSVPGVDVHTATPTQMIFSSKWPYSSVVHQTGTMTRGSTITFPTLAYIPLAAVLIGDGGVINLIDSTQINWYGSPFNINQDWSVQYINQPIWHVTTSSLTVVSTYGSATFTSARYVIFRIPGQ